MRRVMLLTLLAVALPTAGLANSIDFLTGTFVDGSISRTRSGGFGSIGSSFMIEVSGSVATISLTGATLTRGCNVAGNGSCLLVGGTVEVSNPAGTTLFMDSVLAGRITKTATSAIIVAELSPNQGGLGPSGGDVRFDIRFPEGDVTALSGGNGGLAEVPEPGTLALFGIGVIGLAGMVRRKLKLRA